MLVRLLLLTLWVTVTWLALSAQPKGNYTRRLSPPPLNPEKGEVVLNTFRNQRLQGDFFFLFEMTSLPPRRGEGETIAYQGKLWGSWQEGRLASRFLLRPHQTASASEAAPQPINPVEYTAFLARNGNNTQIWKYAPQVSTEVSELRGKAVFEPLLPGLELSAFDLQMSFIFWPEYTYEGVSSSRRTVHRFLMQPPDYLKPNNPDLHQVRIYIESRFHALTKVEMLDAEGDPFKTLRVRKFKKINGRYIVKEIDFFDERTRRKTRFKVIDAVFDPELPEGFFQSQDLPRWPAVDSAW